MAERRREQIAIPREWTDDAKGVSLDPSDATEEMRVLFPANSAQPVFSIKQIDRPPSVRKTTDIEVRCECSRPLFDVAWELNEGGRGWSLRASGVCLWCGKQDVYFHNPPKQTREEREAAVIRAIAAQVLRAGAPPDDEEPEIAAETTESADDDGMKGEAA